MKSFTLQCHLGHEFDLMVKSLESLENQQTRGLVICPYCNSDQVERILARPNTRGGKQRGKSADTSGATSMPVPAKESVPVAKPQSNHPELSRTELEQVYRFFVDIRTKVEKTHENVGPKFAEQARAMHYGNMEERSIYGEASLEQVKNLLDEGVEIAPLPTLPKANA